MVLFSMESSWLNDSHLPTTQNLKEELEENKTKLSIIKNIKVGDKLSKCKTTGTYYIDEAGYTQKFRRWIYGQSRFQTFEDLDKDFSVFMKHLDNVLHPLRHTSSIGYKTVAKTDVQFINETLPGLYNLKRTYPDYEKIQCKIDSIILSLIDFKDEIAKVDAPDHTVKSRAFSFDN